MNYIGVVSHNHANLIINNSKLSLIDPSKFKVIILDNVGELALKEYCLENDFIYLYDGVSRGFGENNNVIFYHILKNHSITKQDYYICFNPDVFIDNETLSEYIYIVSKDQLKFTTLNLFSDNDYKIYDNSLRRFPNLIDFFKSFLSIRNDYVLDKSNLSEVTKIDWVAGSFMCIRCDVFYNLMGFDEYYFMYCEDIDLCYRFHRLYNESIIYFPSFKAVHSKGLNNRKVFSKHFYWHLKSIFRFLLVKNGRLKKHKSILRSCNLDKSL